MESNTWSSNFLVETDLFLQSWILKLMSNPEHFQSTIDNSLSGHRMKPVITIQN